MHSHLHYKRAVLMCGVGGSNLPTVLIAYFLCLDYNGALILRLLIQQFEICLQISITLHTFWCTEGVYRPPFGFQFKYLIYIIKTASPALWIQTWH